MAALGLSLSRQPHEELGAIWAGWRSRIGAEGELDGWRVRIWLAGGLRGERLILKARGPGGRRRLVGDIEQIERLESWVREALMSQVAVGV